MNLLLYQKMTNINISGDKLTEIDKKILENESIVMIDCSNNQIRELPTQICNLRNNY